MSDATTLPTPTSNGFALIGAELWRRTCRPVGQFVYWTFFGLSVVALGGLGLWLELLEYSSGEAGGVFTALITFFPALIGSCCLQMAFESNHRRLLAFALICATIALMSAATLFSTHPRTTWTWAMAIFACLLSLWIWWIANADNLALHDEPTIDAPVGGDPDALLVGDTANFKI